MNAAAAMLDVVVSGAGEACVTEAQAAVSSAQAAVGRCESILRDTTDETVLPPVRAAEASAAAAETAALLVAKRYETAQLQSGALTKRLAVVRHSFARSCASAAGMWRGAAAGEQRAEDAIAARLGAADAAISAAAEAVRLDRLMSSAADASRAVDAASRCAVALADAVEAERVAEARRRRDASVRAARLTGMAARFEYLREAANAAESAGVAHMVDAATQSLNVLREAVAEAASGTTAGPSLGPAMGVVEGHLDSLEAALGATAAARGLLTYPASKGRVQEGKSASAAPEAVRTPERATSPAFSSAPASPAASFRSLDPVIPGNPPLGSTTQSWEEMAEIAREELAAVRASTEHNNGAAPDARKAEVEAAIARSVRRIEMAEGVGGNEAMGMLMHVRRSLARLRTDPGTSEEQLVALAAGMTPKDAADLHSWGSMNHQD